MAHLLLPINGIGHGHLTRALIFAEWLREAGRQPMVALQGPSPFTASPSVPTTNVPALYKLPQKESQRVVNDLAQIALMSGPSVVIEDTHPRSAVWPDGIRRVVVVRPTRFDHMRVLNRTQGRTGVRLLISDHPSSPTWPYDASQTAEILSWPDWVCLGPVFRTATPDGQDRVREHYRLQPDESLFVFTMGGGGEVDNSGDRAAFVETASAIAARLRGRTSRPRFVFLRGPLFPVEIALPPIFEDVREEPELPSLLSLAHGAVIRPGYNVTWECIAAGTPFIALPGTAYLEPIRARLDTLADRGIETSPDVDRLVDPSARERFGAACAEVIAQLDDSPRRLFLANTEAPDVPAPPPRPAAAAPAPGFAKAQLEQLTQVVRDAPALVPLRVRVDDVTRLDDDVRWLLSLCRDLGVRLSLEVVPYHNSVTGAALDRLDPDGAAEIGQHGYAHLPDYRDGAVDVRGEFINCTGSGKGGEQLRLGADLLRSGFGDRFRGGYSSPYDMPPSWLGPAWQAAGGRYLSWISNRPAGNTLPCVRLAVDLWDWKTSEPLDADRLIERVFFTMSRGGIGLVIHPQCVRDPEPRKLASDLLECLISAGCVSTRLSPPAAE